MNGEPSFFEIGVPDAKRARNLYALRLIGPNYDPDNDANHHMSGGSLRDWFDLIIHYREVSPTRPIA